VVIVGKPNGLELARLVRARHPDLPLIVMTGYAAEIARISEERFTVLTKPFDVQTLASAIDAKLANEAVPGA
jgi:DNA-binding NtrC family response regulator